MLEVLIIVIVECSGVIVGALVLSALLLFGISLLAKLCDRL